MDDKHLYILWTSSDPLTAEHMVMMYATNSMLRHWWDAVTVIIWGGAARLAAENPAVRDKIGLARHAGVEFTACVACAVNLGVKEELEAMGIEVKGWGQPLTELLEHNKKLITV